MASFRGLHSLLKTELLERAGYSCFFRLQRIQPPQEIWALTGNLGREAPRGDGRKKRGTGRPNEAKREQKEGKRRGKESEKKRKERKKFKSIVYVLLLRKREFGIYKPAGGWKKWGDFTARRRRKKNWGVFCPPQEI